MTKFEVGKIYKPAKIDKKKNTYKIVGRTLKSVDYVVLDNKPKEVLTAYLTKKNGAEAFKPCNYEGLILAK